MKKVFSRITFILILLCSVVFLCGCNEEKVKKPYLLFNSQPINQKTVYSAQKVFSPGQTIHYVLIMPKGFKNEYLRMQIAKRADNVPNGGISIYMSENLYVDKNKQFYIDKFVIREPGYFIVRFFYGSNTEKPFIENVLWVKE